MASTLGHNAAQARRAVWRGVARSRAGASSRLSSPCSAWSVAMASHLLAQPSVSLAATCADLGGVDPARPPIRGRSYSAMTRPGRLRQHDRRGRRGGPPRGRCGSRTARSGVRSAQIRSSSSCSRSRVIASSAPNGSSMSSTSASWASARARATRWRMPPDSSCGRLSAEARAAGRCPAARRSGSGARPWGPRGPAARARRCGRPSATAAGPGSWNISATRRPPC